MIKCFRHVQDSAHFSQYGYTFEGKQRVGYHHKIAKCIESWKMLGNQPTRGNHRQLKVMHCKGVFFCGPCRFVCVEISQDLGRACWTCRHTNSTQANRGETVSAGWVQDIPVHNFELFIKPLGLGERRSQKCCSSLSQIRLNRAFNPLSFLLVSVLRHRASPGFAVLRRETNGKQGLRVTTNVALEYLILPLEVSGWLSQW